MLKQAEFSLFSATNYITSSYTDKAKIYRKDKKQKTTKISNPNQSSKLLKSEFLFLAI